MSDNTADQKIKHLEELAQKAGVEISPDRMQEIRQKLEGEQHELTKLNEQAQAKLDAPKQENERPALRRDISTLDGTADARLQRTEDNSAAPTDTSATPPDEAPGFQPRAYGERAMADRAESGPEKKDKDIYLAENRLSKL